MKDLDFINAKSRYLLERFADDPHPAARFVADLARGGIALADYANDSTQWGCDHVPARGETSEFEPCGYCLRAWIFDSLMLDLDSGERHEDEYDFQ